MVNFGTATRFEAISEQGEYLGGAIAPGLGISAGALFSRAAKLTRVDIKRPRRLSGPTRSRTAERHLLGYIGVVDGILERISYSS